MLEVRLRRSALYAWRSERNSVLDLAAPEVTQGQRDLVSTWQETGRCRADWMMEGSGGDTTAIRMLGTSMRTSRALLMFSLNCVWWVEVVQER